MTDQDLLATIHGTPWIRQLLADFDFDVARAADGPVEPIRLPGGDAVQVIAGDAAGGFFFLAGDGDARPVVYAGSEGEGGLVATSLRDALTLVAGVSSLHDAAALSADEDGGQALRAFLAQADDDLREYHPALDEDRDRLRAALGLPPVDDRTLRSFQAAAADAGYRPLNEQGDRFQPMTAWLEDPPVPARH